MNITEELKRIIKGEVAADITTLREYSHDASLFEVTPQVVVYPYDDEDVRKLVTYVSEHKKENPNLSLTARAAGTDMGGGSINDSIIVAFEKHFNRPPKVSGNIATTQPGVFYRNFELETLKSGQIFPSYPASRELCAMGGIVNNNSGGEKSLQYGKTERYVKRVKVVLQDGNVYEFKSLTRTELDKKLAQTDFEGRLYQKIYNLITENYDDIMTAKPKVSKNSAGYYLWDVWNKEKDTFDLTKLWVGSQGTLGLMLEADIQLVPIHKNKEMLVIFLNSMDHLGQIIDAVLPLEPESFESYDDNTLKLALKFFPEFAKQLGVKGSLQTALAFLPEFLLILTGGMPKLVLQVEFTGGDPKILEQKVALLKQKIAPLHPITRVAVQNQEKKYWLIRRESFNLLRKKVRDKHTAPFIDDFVIMPHDIPEVIPKVVSMIKKYPEFVYTIAGHVGDGNFHIIPLADIEDPKTRADIPLLAKEVYDIILAHNGSTTGEHNDGLIRTPYLEQMFGKKICALFAETKKIFDPDNVFNPRKKVGGSIDYAMSHLRRNW